MFRGTPDDRSVGRCRQSDRRTRQGQALILFGVMSVVMVLFLGLAVDGGFQYLHRRQAQSAADLIARAGAATKGNGGNDAAVLSAVNAAKAANGLSSLPAGVTATVTNVYIDSAGATVATVGAGTPPSTAAGVRSTVLSTFPTFFTSLLGTPNADTSATAAMTIGALTGFLGGAPLIVCATATNVNTNASETIINSDGSINSAMVGHEYTIWGNNAHNGCGSLGSNWKGVAATGSTATAQGATCTSLPCPYGTSNGTTTGPVTVRLSQAVGGVNGCVYSSFNSGSSGCILLAPIGDTSSPCSGSSLPSGDICVKGWGAFQLTNDCSAPDAGPNCKQTAILQGNAFVVNGTPGTGGPGANTTGPKAFAAIE